ncbi:unnamed protein product [Rangifer tarandus platyrhynchus]|uniref:Uncharacterized protein n=2 Tax=Rangifer tarandus platyrhynchus TaxID=3082113 RepID=A0ACB0ENL6_RANTA|nr:unnamed protein product [Rangifer tarandus platyrhynchus]CAI9702280.1 unnamed protein product [Rangifer tarandus platyrhynchus]
MLKLTQDFSTGKEQENRSHSRALRPHSFKWTLAAAVAPMTSCLERLADQLLGTGPELHTGGSLPPFQVVVEIFFPLRS